jgi:hypothetical protein
LQVDEATGVVTDAHIIAYVRFVLENGIKEDFLFFKPTDSGVMLLGVFNIINHFKEPSQCLDEMQDFRY